MEIQFVNPAREVHPVDLLTVWATIYCPAHERSRRDFFTALLAASLEKPGTFGDLVREHERAWPISKADLARLPSLQDTIQRASNTGSYGGFIAGTILLYITNMAETQPQDATVNKAVHALSVLLARKTDKNSRQIPHSHASIKQAWGRFRSVSHFQAALRMGVHVGSPAILDPLRWESFPHFLALAEEFRRRGESIVPAGRQISILDPRKTWRCPTTLRLPEYEFNLPGLVPKAIAALDNYAHE